MPKHFGMAAFIGLMLALTCLIGSAHAPSAADAAGVVQIAATATRDTGHLNTEWLTVTATLPAPQPGRVSVQVTLSGSTALSFQPGSGTVTIPAGATSGTVKAIVFVPPLIGNATAEVKSHVTRPTRSTLTTNPSDLSVAIPSPFGPAPTPGYWLATAKAGVYAFSAPFYGSLSTAPSSPIVGMAETPAGDGYWLADAAGNVYAFGGATLHGSLPSRPPSPITAIAADPVTGGYWLFGQDGAVYAFDAKDYGHPSNVASHVVAAAAAPNGRGYWLATANGGVLAFGPGAKYQGDAAGDNLTAPVVGIAADPHTGGYWLVTAKGAVYAFGAPQLGEATGQQATAIAADPASRGYWVSTADGGVFAFGAKYYGSAAPDHPRSSIIAIVGR